MKLHRLVTVAAVASALVFAAAMSASADVIYDTIPTPLPGNIVSLGYQARSTSESGDHIAFSGTARKLTTVTATMSSWARTRHT